MAARVREVLDTAQAAPPDAQPWSEPDSGAGAGGVGVSGRAPLTRRLLARVPLRLDPGRRGALGIGLAVLVAAVVTAIWLAAQRPQSTSVSAPVPKLPLATPVGTDRPTTQSGASRPSSGPAGSATAAPPRVVVVDVAGKVRRPGLYRLPAGSRVDDAVTAAGGAPPGVALTNLNLAALLADGQQILVGLPAASGAPAPAQAGATGSGATGSGMTTGALVDLNAASLEQLETLPGVGPVLGQHILDWRAEHGRFTSIGQLNDVSGIGDVKFAALRAHVTV